MSEVRTYTLGEGVHFKPNRTYADMMANITLFLDACDSDGLWKPTKDGLGMRHCIEQINELMGKEIIRI